MNTFVLISLFSVLISSSLANTITRDISDCPDVCDSGEGKPLYLSQLLNRRRIGDAKRLSKVCSTSFAENVESYSGFLTVNTTFNSNLFFWFFPALNLNASAPVLLWLNGGPGHSSLFGLFVENGPLVVDSSFNVHPRIWTWAQNFSILFIDNPIGAGFSFTENEKGYATSQDDVARDLYSALQQFFNIFSEYRNNDFYIVGESYGAKFALSAAYKIHQEGKASNINLKGIGIGNGWIDPKTSIYHGDLLYDIGLFDETQNDIFNNIEDQGLTSIDNEQYLDAYLITAPLFQSINGRPSLFTNYTGSTNYNNFLLSSYQGDFFYYPYFLEKNSTRCAIHVGNTRFEDGFDGQKKVMNYLVNDIMRPARKLLRTLLDANYKFLVYNGNLDVLVAPVFTEKLLWELNWNKNELYRKTEPVIWKVDPSDPDVAGFVRKADNLVQVSVKNAGHTVPYDQPRAALDMISRFIWDLKF